MFKASSAPFNAPVHDDNPQRSTRPASRPQLMRFVQFIKELGDRVCADPASGQNNFPWVPGA